MRQDIATNHKRLFIWLTFLLQLKRTQLTESSFLLEAVLLVNIF